MVSASTTVSISISELVTKVIGAARELYVYQQAEPRANLPSWERQPEDLRVYDTRLCVLLLPAVPEEVKRSLGRCG